VDRSAPGYRRGVREQPAAAGRPGRRAGEGPRRWRAEVRRAAPGRGKLLARERIELLLDRDSAFLELSPLAAWGSDYTVGASLVSGIGVVSGVECVITANDPTVRGGSSNPWTVRKAFRAHDIARENRLPLVNLVESGGADLPSQAEIFVPGGRLFRDLTQLSAAGIPTVALVFGNSTAGGAYVPGMSDHVVMIRERSKVFLGGPPLVKMATGEDADDESLGGAEMHARVSVSPTTSPPTSGTRCASAGGSSPGSTGARPARAHRAAGRAAVRPGRAARDRRRRPAGAVRSAGRAGPGGGRFPVRRAQAGVRAVAADRLGVDPRLPGRHPRQRARGAVRRGVAEGAAVHPAGQPDRHAAGVPAEHDRLHGRDRVRAGRDHPDGA
jgi:hypothetical protein